MNRILKLASIFAKRAQEGEMIFPEETITAHAPAAKVSDPKVRALQQKLKQVANKMPAMETKFSMDPGVIDGISGPNTQRANNNYEQALQLGASGYLDLIGFKEESPAYDSVYDGVYHALNGTQPQHTPARPGTPGATWRNQRVESVAPRGNARPTSKSIATPNQAGSWKEDASKIKARKAPTNYEGFENLVNQYGDK